MIWAIDQFGDRFYATDLYGINIWSDDRDLPVKIFCEERRYRYSGTLYSKMNSLINMMCFNRYIAYNTLAYGHNRDNCYYATFRYDSYEFIHIRTYSMWKYPTHISNGDYSNKIYYRDDA